MHDVVRKRANLYDRLAWPLREQVAEILGRLPEEFFDLAGASAMWEDHLSGKRYNLNMIWALVMWELWYEKFIAQR